MKNVVPGHVKIVMTAISARFNSPSAVLAMMVEQYLDPNPNMTNEKGEMLEEFLDELMRISREFKGRPLPACVMERLLSPMEVVCTHDSHELIYSPGQEPHPGNERPATFDNRYQGIAIASVGLRPSEAAALRHFAICQPGLAVVSEAHLLGQRQHDVTAP